jgi:hypothetical protein
MLATAQATRDGRHLHGADGNSILSNLAKGVRMDVLRRWRREKCESILVVHAFWDRRPARFGA